MDDAEFLGLTPTDDPLRWRLPVADSLTTAKGSLFGGVALGAAITALEHVTARPLVWGTAQYLAYAAPPAVLDLDPRFSARVRTRRPSSRANPSRRGCPPRRRRRPAARP